MGEGGETWAMVYILVQVKTYMTNMFLSQIPILVTDCAQSVCLTEIIISLEYATQQKVNGCVILDI